MPIFTKGEFLRTTQSQAGTKGISGILKESKRFSRRLYKTSAFLSHSHKDKDTVEQAVAFLGL